MQFLTRVTVTGADTFTNRRTMYDISQEFPFVEWGILLSKSKEGKENRFPDESWIDQLFDYPLNYAGHLCGSWVRDFVNGGNEFTTERPRWTTPIPVHGTLFKRLQLNISHIVDHVDRTTFLKVLQESKIASRFIIQVRSIVPSWWPTDRIDDVDFLYDCSGGRGVLTPQWPTPMGMWQERKLLPNCGYAGGLSPDNLAAQLPLMEKAAEGQPVWIDVESGVRTSDVFDLDKVRRFLSIAQPYVLDQN